jgi:hypothetical protein
MDSIRAKFVWQEAEENFKYHMAKWDMVSRPKDQGGLGIINTRIMNDCLLVKWIWKIFQEPDELWFKIIKAKYLGDGGFFDSKTKGVSQFWQGLHRVKHLFNWGATFQVRNGKHCKFWKDCWAKDVPLCISHENLYKMVRNPSCCVSDCWDEDGWDMDFRRALSVHEYNYWLELIESLNDVKPGGVDADIVLWALEHKRQFSTKSLYRFLTNRGMTSRVARVLWKCRIPLKIKFFLWQVFHNKLQVSGNLVKRGWKGNKGCCLCASVENIDHLFFKCHLAKFVWGLLMNVFSLESCPASLEILSVTWLQGKGPLPSRLMLFFFAGFAWALWIMRNKMTIEKNLYQVTI